MDKEYSKRELDMKFKSAEEKNDAWSATILTAIEDMRKHEIQPILAQTTLTNGRVSSLEKWRTWLVGAAFIFVPVFLSVAGWIIMKQLSLESDIQTAVDARFAPYEITN